MIIKTVTTIFLVPTLKINKDSLQSNGFINGYVHDLSRDVQYEHCIYLLFKPENIEKFREFLDKEYERTKDVIDDYDLEDGVVVVVYKLNDKYQSDIELVMQGKYSQTSNEFQSIFPKIIKIVKNGLHKDEISLQYRIFKKSMDLRAYWEDRIGETFTEDMEVWKGFDLFSESLDLDKVKQEMYEDA